MEQIITPLIIKTFGIPQGTRSGILPFTEKPSGERINNADKQPGHGIDAADLFSLFTADIIKEEVVFTR